MRNVRLALALVLTAGLVSAADDKDKKELKGDIAKFQGKWKTMVGANKDLTLLIEFDGEKIKAEFKNDQGEARKFSGKVVINESVNPKSIDFVDFKMEDGNDSPPTLGIYLFDKDQLTICTGEPNGARPTEFKGADEGFPRLHVFDKDK